MTHEASTMHDVDHRFGVRAELRALRPYEPGRSAEAVRREFGLDRVVKLGSNESPWGPLPVAAAAIRDAVDGLNRYPDGAFHELRHRIAATEGVDATEVVLGNGADAILINLSLALLDPGDEVVFGWPSFITYPLSVRKAGATPVAVPLDAEGRYDLDAMFDRVGPQTKAIYVCSPNNPTGTFVEREQLHAFVRALPPRVLCVVDEAYHEYAAGDPSYPRCIPELVAADDAPGNVMVLRTFSKAWGLAGLRVGWAVAPHEIVHAIDTVRGPFELGTLGNVAALASLDVRDELAPRIAATADGRARLDAALRDLGLEPFASAANFVCTALPRGLTGRDVFDRMQRAGVIVRPLDAFGMPDGIRVTVGTPDETRLAVAALGAVLA